jgi:hypothetical protein
MNTKILTAAIVLSGLEAALNQANCIVVLDHDDLDNDSASGTPTQTLELFAVEDGDVVTFRGMRLVTPFEDASDAAFNSTDIEVGDGADPAVFLTSTEVNKNGTEVTQALGTGTLRSYTAADTVDVKVTSTASKALANLDGGKLVLLFDIKNLKKLATAAVAV